MKKFLSLVLALVMAMSLVTVSAGAEYKDAADIKYDEAVAVLSALDIVGGSGNKFMPNGTLTRGAAAKIITNLAAGPDAALDASASEFSDVAAGSTFAKYINYLAGEKIVGGYSDGTYRPSAGQSGYAYLKMLLGVIGYDSEVEGYSGSGWQARALNDAEEAGLLKDMKGFVPGNTITRDNAAMLAFNALKATMVKYDGGLDVTTGDTTITVGAERENVGEYGEIIADGYNKIEATPYTQYVEKKFDKLLKKAVYGEYASDDFGRDNAYVWELDGEVVYVAEPEADIVYTAAIDSSKEANLKAIRAELEKAGVEMVDTDTDGKFYEFTAFGSVNTCAEIADLTANGKLVEIYIDEVTGADVIVDIVEVDYAICEELEVETNDDGDVTYTVALGVEGTDLADNTYDDDDVVVVGTVKDGDVVTYVEANGTLYIYATTMFTGAQSAENAAGTKLTIGGKEYTIGYAATAADYANSATVKEYFLDQYGYVVAVKGISTAAATDYVYVLDAFVKGTESLGGFTVTATIKGLLADGTVGEFDVEVKKAAKANSSKGIEKNDWMVGDTMVADKDDTMNTVVGYVKDYLGEAVSDTYPTPVFGYTKSGNTLKLEAVAVDTAAEEGDIYVETSVAALNKNTIKYASAPNMFVNSKTIFVVYNTEDKAATVYVGGANLPSFVSDPSTGVRAVAEFDGSESDAVVIFAQTAAKVAAASTEEYVFIDASEFTMVLNADEENVKQFTGTYANGKTVVVTDPDNVVNADRLYILNDDKTVEEIYGDTETEVTAAMGMSLKGDVLGVNGVPYYVTDKTETVVVNKDYKKVDGATGIVVREVKDGAPTNNVVAIFVTGESALEVPTGAVLATTSAELKAAVESVKDGGDVIIALVAGESYTWWPTENLLIAGNITILGNGASVDCIAAVSGDLTVENLTIGGTEANAIRYAYGKISMKNCTIKNGSETGIRFDAGSFEGGVIENCTFVNCYRGIIVSVLDAGKTLTVKDCDFSGCSYKKISIASGLESQVIVTPAL